jgi:hypothetical protein
MDATIWFRFGYNLHGQWRRHKHAQSMRTETVRLHGARDGRGLDLCAMLCSVTFCPCNMPAIIARRRRIIQMQATSFFLWVRWRPEWEYIDTPHRAKWSGRAAHSMSHLGLIRKGYPQA